MNRETVLPKNIRQIGEIQQDKKVYLEDYVITFIRKKAKEAGDRNCAGVLAGTMERDGEDSFVFVRGALLLDDQQEPEQRWKQVEEDREKNFPDSQMIGCFILGVLDEAYMAEIVEMLPQPPVIVFHMQEEEETVYWSQENQYQRLKGFFIFYERNPQMQKYMAEHCEPKEVEKEEGNSDEAIITFRKKVAQKKRTGKSGGVRYLASSFLVLTILVLGVTIINNYDKMKQIEATMSQLAEEQNEQRQSMLSQSEAQTVNVTGTAETEKHQNEAESETAQAEAENTMSETEEGAAKAASSGTVTADGETVTGESETVEASAAETEDWEEETGEDDSVQTSASTALDDFADTITSQALQERNYSAEDPQQVVETEELGKTDEVLEAANRQSRSMYTVRYGDTLADISVKYYGTLEKVEEICELNGIDDANLIVPGEKIVLP